jgi:hypothetical protein
MDYILAYRFNIADKHRYWDWNILQTYRSELTRDNDRQLLSCVREYITTVYNALISEQVGATVPSRQHTSPFEHAQGRRNRHMPDFKRSSEWMETPGFDEKDWSNAVASVMASTGFDILTRTLQGTPQQLHDMCIGLLSEMVADPPVADITNVIQSVGPWPTILPVSWHSHDFIRRQRQRAWALFDDGLSLEQSLTNAINNQEHADLTVVDFMANRWMNELICHGGGRAYYSSLMEGTRRFWALRASALT